MHFLLKYYLPLFVVLFNVVVFVLPSIRVYRQTGINPFRFVTRHNEAHDFIGASMKIFILLLLLTVMLHSFAAPVYDWLAPFRHLETTALKSIGFVLGHAALLGIVVAQWQMKQSWRIGIDYENKTGLVTHGLFRFSRNPIYSFLLMALTGLFFILPNAVTFAVLFAAYLVLQITVRLEEDFLAQQHGESYERYKANVRRFI